MEKKKLRNLIAYTFLTVISATYASANTSLGLSSNSKEPVVITADKSLEWHRNDLRFIAKKNALAKQGASSVAADQLTALYRKGQTSSMEIYNLKAQGSVVLTSDVNKAYGDYADYDLDKGLAIMTGKNLRMVSPDQTVTAKERFEYWDAEGRLNAIGEATIIRPKPNKSGTDTLSAHKITALLKENAQGKRVLHIAEAFDNVVIITPTETVTGNYGIYRADINKAEIKGNVVIKRGPNTLQGERAEVDLNTNISKIFGKNGQENGRVRGVFYPGSKN